MIEPRCLFRPLAAAALLSAAAAAPAAPADPPRLTLADCLRIGLERAAPVKRSRLDEAAAAARIGETRAQVLPDLTARGEYTRLDEVPAFDIGDASVPAGRADNYTASAEVRQLLYSGGSVGAALRAAREYRDRSRALTRWQALAVERDIRVGFHDLLLAKERLAVQQETVDQLAAFARESERHRSAGTESEFGLLSARVRLANEQPPLIAARRDLTLARASFQNLLHLDRDDFELDGELAYQPFAVSLEQCLERARERPDVRAQEFVVHLIEADIRYERGFGYPQLRARAAYKGANPDTTFGSSADEWAWHWNAGLTVEWTLFDGARRRHAIRSKSIQREQAILDLDELRRGVDLGVRRAWLDLRHAADAVGAARETASLAERGLGIARVRQETGLSTYLEFTDAALALRTARLAWQQALRDHVAARADLRRACGLGGDETLESTTP